MHIAPIILFTYKRLSLLQNTIKSLKSNLLAKESNLIIYSDGPKNIEENQQIIKIRQHLSSLNGFRKIEIIEQTTNIGLANSIIKGVSEQLDKYGKVIVIEDDLVLSKYFLAFMNEALELYKNEESVISIHGFVYPLKIQLPETFFIKGADCWGWATWKRGWDLFEHDALKLLNKIDSQNLKEEFDFGGNANYYKMLGDQVNNKIDSWAIRWYASAFLADKLTLYPGKTLVNNIGFASEATHTRTKLNYNSPLYQDQIKVEKIAIEENKLVRELFVNYFKEIKGGIVKKITDYLRSKMHIRLR